MSLEFVKTDPDLDRQLNFYDNLDDVLDDTFFEGKLYADNIFGETNVRLGSVSDNSSFAPIHRLLYYECLFSHILGDNL